MTNRPLKLTREETLALVCALMMTTILCTYSLSLKREELEEKSSVTLSEYAEPLNIPRERSDLSQRNLGRTERELTSPSTVAEPGVTRHSRSFADTAHPTVFRSIPTRDSLIKASRPQSDSAGSGWSLVFLPYKRSWELDSIFKTEGEAGASLLREHMFHENQVYDTLLTNHLIRLGKEFARFDASPNLENYMKWNMRRYGSPHNPLRPQPPSAQVPLLGIVIPVLDFLYTKAKEVPAAVTRVVKPREKKAPE